MTAAIAQLWEEGCPAAMPPYDEIVDIAIRRWRSSERRRVKQSDHEARIRDLTKGLIAHFDERDVAGWLNNDYECVAERVAAVLTSADG